MSFKVPKFKLAETWKELKFPEVQNDLLLRAAAGEETPRAPVWVMRQAGKSFTESIASRSNITPLPSRNYSSKSSSWSRS